MPPAGCEAVVGVVRLRVQFLATGKIGEVTVLQGLPDGKTEAAVEAARKITFEPSKVDGVAQDVTKSVEYTFTLPFDEDSPELRSKAVITKTPKPKFPRSSIPPGPVRVVEVTVTLDPDSKAAVQDIRGDLSFDIRTAAAAAAEKIKFKPAVHKCGAVVPQKMLIRYEVK